MPQKLQHQFILPTRFRLHQNLLDNFGVHVFTSNWRKEADDLARSLSGNVRSAKTSLFNQAVLALSPVLVHGFNKYTGTQPNMPLYQMLALEQYPGVPLVKSLAKHWADVWLETSFANVPDGCIRQQSQRLYDLIEDTGAGWVEKSAQEALTDQSSGIRYSALPSLIAARFASTGVSEINGKAIKWGLIQQSDNKLAVVSDPQPLDGGTFAYLIRFSLQFQPGNPEPWIHTSLTCQRYIDEEFISGNKDRKVTILLRLGRPLHQAWAHNQTLVRLPVWDAPRKGGKQDRSPRFEEGFHALLDRAQAREIIHDPSLILSEPLTYRSVDGDGYFVLYAEGYDPGHPLGNGFGARERTEIFRDLKTKLDDILVPGNYLPLFQGGIASQALAPWRDTEKRAPSDPLQKREKRLHAIRAATGNRSVRILLMSINGDMGKAMREYLVGRHLKIDENDLPIDGFEFIDLQIPDHLARPLEPGDFTKEKRLEAEKQMANEWQKFLRPHKGADTTRMLAWIELPSNTSDFTSPHNAIRMACVKEGIASQMIHKLRSDYERLSNMGRNFGHKGAMFDFGRLYNACGDLLLRQMGVAQGDTKDGFLTADYEKAGFPPEFAKNLVVVGLTVFKNQKDNYRGRGSVEFPIAVRIFPNGKVEAKIPSVCDWTEYFDAAIALGNEFIKRQRHESFYLDRPATFEFIQDLLSKQREMPSLLILDAYKLRTVWSSLQVAKLKQGQLTLGGDVYESSDMLDMNVIWLRQQADGETPQYVVSNETDWADADDADRIAHASLFEDADVGGDFKHFFSVGRLDNDNKADQAAMRHGEGSEMNFRNQQMLELVPVMGRFGEAAATVTHMLRSSPAWNIGNTVLPYPIHLANKMVEDMLPLLGVDNDIEEQG